MVFPHVRIRRHFADADATDSPQQKGDHLEAIGQLLFESVPGIELVEKKAVNSANSIEIDLVFLNNLHKNGFADFERVILVECKNWSDAVDSKTVRDFHMKLLRKKRTYGFLLAASGITGNPNEATAAYNEINNALVVFGIFIIVFSRAEIEALRSAGEFVRQTKIKMAKIIIAA